MVGKNDSAQKMMHETLARACVGTSDRESQDWHRRMYVCCEYERTKPEVTTLPSTKSFSGQIQADTFDGVWLCHCWKIGE